MAASAMVLVAGGCGTAKRAGPPASTPLTTVTSTTTPSTTTSTTADAPSTTAPYAPSAPQASPDAAAARLVSAWSVGDRATAATVAAPGAVSVLFAIHYPSGWIQPRGCTDPSVSPGTCTYRNTYNDAIYEIAVSHLPAGWYVSAVTPES